jgi:BA14K-like protein
MKDIQAHLDKIRSDAAECVLLSNLVTDGKGAVFARAAEHLNDLASAVEKATATAGTDVARVANHEETIATDKAAAHQQETRPRRVFPWMLIAVLGVAVGAVGTFFLANSPDRQYRFEPALLSKHEPPPALRDETKQAIAALLSGEQGDRKTLIAQLGAMATHIDNLERALDNLKTARVGIADPSSKESVGTEERPAPAETKPLPAEEKPVRSEENHASAPGSPAAAKQFDSAPPASGSPTAEPDDRVGSIPIAPRQAELVSRKPANGPPGCKQFRSFDRVSGTYTTLEGRRRPCR